MSLTLATRRLLLRLLRLGRQKSILRIGRALGAIVTLTSLVIVLRQAGTELATIDWRIYLVASSLIFVAYGVSFGLQILPWAMLIAGLAKTPFGWRDLETYARSNLMRRTPGPVWYLLERVERYRESGVYARFTLTASGLEWVLLLLAALITFLITKFPGPQTEILWIELAVVLIVGLMGCLISSDTDRNNRASPDLTTSLRARSLALWPQIALSLFIYEICIMLGGFIVFELVRVIDPSTSMNWLTGLNLWSLTAGVAIAGSILIPLNFGIREIALVFILLPHTTPVTAVTVAALLRTIFLVADVGYSLLLFVLSRWMAKRLRPNGPLRTL